MFDLAGGSRALLVHQLYKTPGFKQFLADTNTPNQKLFRILRRRAAENLHGFEGMVSRRDYLLDDDFDPTISRFVDTKMPATSNTTRLHVVLRDQKEVYVLDALGQNIVLKTLNFIPSFDEQSQKVITVVLNPDGTWVSAVYGPLKGEGCYTMVQRCAATLEECLRLMVPRPTGLLHRHSAVIDDKKVMTLWGPCDTLATESCKFTICMPGDDPAPSPEKANQVWRLSPITVDGSTTHFDVEVYRENMCEQTTYVFHRENQLLPFWERSQSPGPSLVC